MRRSIVIGAWLAAVAARGGELVRHGGFEEGDGMPKGWQVAHFAGKAEVSRVTDARAEGAFALRVSVTEMEVLVEREGRKTVNPVRVFQEVVPAPLGQIVTVEAKALVRRIAGRATLRLEVAGPDRLDVLAAGETSWTEVATGFVARSVSSYVPAGAAALRVYLSVEGEGEVLFDGVKAQGKAPPVLMPGVNALANPGFEEGDASWETFGAERGAIFTVTADAARSGRAGARIERLRDEGRVLANWGQGVVAPSVSGKEIVVRGSMRARGVKGKAFLGAFFRGRDGKGAPLERFVKFENMAVSGDSAWVEMEQRVSLQNLTIDAIWVRALLDGTGTVDIDDMELSLSTPVKPRGSPVAIALLVIALTTVAGLLAFLWRR